MSSLHPRLETDTHQLGSTQSGILLLHTNALVPWFILVPDTEHQELFHMPTPQCDNTWADIHTIARFVESHFEADKINIATIGNIVPQLHVHIIARFTSDPWWPDPVWGKPDKKTYQPDQVDSIRIALQQQGII